MAMSRSASLEGLYGDLVVPVCVVHAALAVGGSRVAASLHGAVGKTIAESTCQMFTCQEG